MNHENPACNAAKSKPRQGYALLVCLLVAAISSLAVLGILNSVRFETLESMAKQQAVNADWVAQAGIERGTALLIDNPNLRGPLPAIEFPPRSNQTIALDIQQSGQTLTVVCTVSMNGLVRTRQSSFSIAQLQQRIAYTTR